jgi:hypothetical protein
LHLLLSNNSSSRSRSVWKTFTWPYTAAAAAAAAAAEFYLCCSGYSYGYIDREQIVTVVVAAAAGA